jgi:hypothetical protein
VTISLSRVTDKPRGVSGERPPVAPERIRERPRRTPEEEAAVEAERKAAWQRFREVQAEADKRGPGRPRRSQPWDFIHHQD